MKHYTLDVRNIFTKEALHYHIARDLGFPSYYGRNLDALMDCLTDIREDCEIEILGMSELMKYLKDYSSRTLSVFHQAAYENRHLTLIFREPGDI